MISMDVTHSPFLRETCIDSGVSILNFGMARNLFSELKPMTGLQQLLGFGTRKRQLWHPRLSWVCTTLIAPFCSRS